MNEKIPKTIPSFKRLGMSVGNLPSHMYPNAMPEAFYITNFLSDEECDKIVFKIMAEEPYQFKTCNAITRECPRPLDKVLNPIWAFGIKANELYWQMDIDPHSAGAWLQTYHSGNDYPIHTDGYVGQTRKLSVIAFLSDSNLYSGGDLALFIEEYGVKIPKDRGTVVAFLPWVRHLVTPVESGLRQTINLGFWGPSWK